MSSSIQPVHRPPAKVFIATTVMLTFISFRRAAAIVLSDLASSAYCAGGVEKVIGKSAPWFILAVMLFSYAVRALYIESSRIACGRSNKLSTDQQAKLTGDAWERLPEPRPRLVLEIYETGGNIHEYQLGPHSSRLRRAGIWNWYTSYG